MRVPSGPNAPYFLAHGGGGLRRTKCKLDDRESMTRRKTPIPLDHPPGSATFTTEEVCRGHLEAAIEVYARQWNVPAATLLANAAHELMRGYAKNRDLPLRADIKTAINESLPSDEARIAIDAVMSSYNAMKHRNGETVTIHHRFVELTLYSACAEFGALFGKLSVRMVGYQTWVLATLEGVSPRQPDYLRIFPKALTGDDRLSQLQGLRELLDGINRFPDQFPDVPYSARAD